MTNAVRWLEKCLIRIERKHELYFIFIVHFLFSDFCHGAPLSCMFQLIQMEQYQRNEMVRKMEHNIYYRKKINCIRLDHFRPNFLPSAFPTS